MLNIEKEREAFESTRVGELNNVVFVMNEYWPEGHYVGKSNHNEDTDDAHYLSHSWFSWVDRAKLEAKKLEGCVVVPDQPVAYKVQNKSWTYQEGNDYFEVKLVSEMPEPAFAGDSYDIEIPLYAAVEAARGGK